MRFLWFSVGLIVLFLFSGCATAPNSARSVSVSDEVRLGEQAFRELSEKTRLSSNAHWSAILQRVGERLAEVAEAPAAGARWDMRLIDNKEKNIFCLPGGKCAFTSGLFRASLNEAGVAALLAHAMAHVVARDPGARLVVALGIPVSPGAWNRALHGRDRDLVMGALGVATPLEGGLPFGAEQEQAADAQAVEWLAKAGYDPAAAVPVWESLARAGNGAVVKTHPWDGERAKHVASAAEHAKGEHKYGLGSSL